MIIECKKKIIWWAVLNNVQPLKKKYDPPPEGLKKNLTLPLKA